MQAMKTPKPRKPPRNSRQAKCSGNKRLGFAAGASIIAPLGMTRASTKCVGT